MKRRKVERSNRNRVVCLRCDKVLNRDNVAHHQRSKHEGLIPKFQDVADKSQRLLNFGGLSKPVDKVSLYIPYILWYICSVSVNNNRENGQ